MSKFQLFDYAGWGEFAATEVHMSQSVRVGDRIEISGQGKFGILNTLEVPCANQRLQAQIENAFANVDLALKNAGASKGVGQAYKVVSYHCPLGEKTTELMVKAFRKHFPDHRPLWTEIGVAKLGLPDMKVEIEVVAVAD
ncbi:YjgF-like protein [Microthyrium microscopicum]|uniref:YjgF-like protein n=1 Tax=Microthyrium microscopicum TaxID=703497 RepID=A0A6A6UF73_9PEZI|nr:YjgF-like protein [Microthyrium microscopicum]